MPVEVAVSAQAQTAEGVHPKEGASSPDVDGKSFKGIAILDRSSWRHKCPCLFEYGTQPVESAVGELVKPCYAGIVTMRGEIA